MPKPKRNARTKPTPATYPNLLAEILVKLKIHHEATHDALEQSSLREAAISAQEDPCIGVTKDPHLARGQKGFSAREKSKARKLLRQFASGELSEAELSAHGKGLHNLLSRHYTWQEHPRTPLDFVMREIEIDGVSINARALSRYLALLAVTLKQGRDASRLKLSGAAKHADVAIAKLSRDKVFMERLISGLSEKYSDEAREAGLSQVGEKAGSRRRKKVGRPMMSPEEQELAKKFYEGLNKSHLTLPAYCEREEIEPKEGRRWRDWGARRENQLKKAVNRD